MQKIGFRFDMRRDRVTVGARSVTTDHDRPGRRRYKTGEEGDTRGKPGTAAEMDARFLILVLSLVVAANGLSEDDVKESQEWANRLEDMRFCLNQENVTEDEMKAFLFQQKEEDANECLKMAVYCFVKRINFFDGVSWNMEVIAESESKNPEMLKVINECLTKDDFTLSAHERAYQAQKCILERGSQ